MTTLENTVSLIQEIKTEWTPSLQGTRTHVRLVIKHYSQMDRLVFHRQLDTTLRGLIVSGHTWISAQANIIESLREKGIDENEWLNGRTAKEIISNNSLR